MSSRKRRKARRIRLATRAHGAFFRDPGRVALSVAFYARHGAVSRRYGDMLVKRFYLRNVARWAALYLERDGIIYRRLM